MPENDILHILGANVVSDHLLRHDFDDQTLETVVVAPLIERPVFEPLRDPKYFEKALVDPLCSTIVGTTNSVEHRPC